MMFIFKILIMLFCFENVMARSIFRTPLYFSEPDFDTPSAARNVEDAKNTLGTDYRFSLINNEKYTLDSTSLVFNLNSQRSLGLFTDFRLTTMSKDGSKLIKKFSPNIDLYWGEWLNDHGFLFATKASHKESFISEISELQRLEINSVGFSITKEFVEKYSLLFSYILNNKKYNTYDYSALPAGINSNNSIFAVGVGLGKKCNSYICPFSSELIYRLNIESEKKYLKKLNFNEVYIDFFAKGSSFNSPWGLGISNSLFFYKELKSHKFYDAKVRLQYFTKSILAETYFKETFKPTSEIANSQFYIKKKTIGLKFQGGIYEFLYFGFLFEKSKTTNQKNKSITNEKITGGSINFVGF